VSRSLLSFEGVEHLIGYLERADFGMAALLLPGVETQADVVEWLEVRSILAIELHLGSSALGIYALMTSLDTERIVQE